MKIKKGWYWGIALIACVLLLAIPASAYCGSYSGGGGGFANSSNVGVEVCNVSISQRFDFVTWTAQYPNEWLTCNATTGNNAHELHTLCGGETVCGYSQGFNYYCYTDCSIPDDCYLDDDLRVWWNGIDWEGNNNALGYHILSTPPPQPTPTPTPIPTVAPGSVRSTFVTRSSTTWNIIHGSNIMLYDTYTGTWKNSTSDADGILYIDTLPYTTINYEATFTIFENEYAPASGTANADANGGTFNILMYPVSSPAPTGYVNLFVSTMDGDHNVLRDVTVSAVWGGYQHTSSSGTYGTVQWVVPNQTQVHLTGTKIGYDGADEVINTGEGPSYSTILYLEEEIVTPTPTTTTTYTVIPTVVIPTGAGYANAQGQNMLNWLAANGMELVQLCFFVTILALLGVKFGK